MTPAAADPLAELQAGALCRFSDQPHPAIPRFAAGVYTIWLDEKLFACVGMAGRSITSGMLDTGKKSGLASRLASAATHSEDAGGTWIIGFRRSQHERGLLLLSVSPH